MTQSDRRLLTQASIGLDRKLLSTKNRRNRASQGACLLIRLTTILSLWLGCNHTVAEPSHVEYQLMKLRAESARLEREKEELSRRQEAEGLRVASYNDQLGKVVSEFQTHIADQHQRIVSCIKCRQLAKRMTQLSRKIERGVF